jgi:hypothetical protein
VIRLLVDFNSVDREGRVRARVTRPYPSFVVGQVVDVFDGEGSHAKATIDDFDADIGLVRLVIDPATWWEESRVHFAVDPRLGWVKDDRLVLIGTASTAATGLGVAEDSVEVPWR